MRILSIIDRFSILLRSDCAKLNTVPLIFRVLKLIYLLLKQKNIIFNVKAKMISFDFIFKPYKSVGYGGRGQFLYREFYDRFFLVNLNIFKKKINTFVDIGCSRGFFSVYVTKAYNCKTISIDLYDYAISDCRENLKLNNISGGILKRAAVGSHEDNGKSLILDKKQVPSRTSVLESKKTTFDSSNALQMTSIDEVLTSHKINSFDLLKIDVEGYELEVLEGSINSIKKYRPIIYLEFSRKKFEIIKLFNEINYLAFMPLSNGELLLINDINFPKSLYENIFLVPKENASYNLL